MIRIHKLNTLVESASDQNIEQQQQQKKKQKNIEHYQHATLMLSSS